MTGLSQMADGGTPVVWRDVREWGVEGKGWGETGRYFARLPARAKPVLREALWERAQHSAGLCVRFETDATLIAARWTLLYDVLAKVQMPATSVSGLDLYADRAGPADRSDAAPGNHWRWLAIGRPEAFPTNEVVLARDLAPGRRRYMVYLPLYNGVEALEVGVPATASFVPVAPRTERPIVFYGTSIVHGAAASRAGMAFPAILGRRLERPVLNLGFGGQGHMESEMGALLAELDPCVYVVDCLPNMDAALVDERAEPLVSALREARPHTPVVLVEDRSYASADLRLPLRERNLTSRIALRRVYDRLIDSGLQNLTYVPGDQLLGTDGEATADGSHPTDLGCVRIADTLEPLLRPLVSR